MGIVIIDGQQVEVGDRERINGIQAARRVGVDIPHYCWHAGLSVVASCRMCLVETGAKNDKTGEITMLPKLVPACQTPAKDGVVFVTTSDKVKHARAFVEEQLLIHHPVDCPICDKAGECHLQDYHFEHGQDQRRADIRPFTSRRRDMGDTVTLFVDRCVMCSRCVRFCREVSGTGELMVTHRGNHEEIDVLPGFPLDNKLSGNVVDLCPVGALCDKDFLYQQRVWFMKRHAGVCAGCSTGCSIWTEQNQDHVFRLKPRENPHINEWWMCDEGRYSYHHIHDERRLVGPRRMTAGRHEELEWHQVAVDLVPALRAAGRLAVAISPELTVEEAYLLIKLVRSIDAEAIVGMSPVPRIGEDEVFKNGFTIRAEKCPNRRGVEELVRHFAGELLEWDELVNRAAAMPVRAMWITAGYPGGWRNEADVARLAPIELVVMQDIFSSPLWERAHYQLPSGAFAERDGSFVNHADRLQSFGWAVRPPTGAWVEGQLYWRLFGRPGLYQSRRVLSEVAGEVLYFAAAAGDIPDVGLDLRVNLLAAADSTAGQSLTT